MPLGFASYEISVSGLRANERSLFTVGHNITNAEVRGYSRQMSMHTTSFYAFAGRNAGLMQVGLGAGTQETRQIRNIFLDIVYRQENTHLGLWDVRNGTYQEVQAIVSDPIFQGLKDTMYNFWDSWHELSKDPASLSMRGVMLQRAEAMVDHMNHLGKQFDELQRNLNNEILVKVNQVNRITAEIAAINRAIARNEVVLGDHANDLRDKRNLLLDSLTRIADFDIEEKRDGMVQVTLGGYPLVYNDRQWLLSAHQMDGDGTFYTPIILYGKTVEDGYMIPPIKSGELKGLLQSRGEVSGMRGSLSNGSPNDMAEVVLVIDPGSSNIDRLQDDINEYVASLIKSGLKFNLRLVNGETGAELYNGLVDDGMDTDFMTGAFISRVKTWSETPGGGGIDMDALVGYLTDPLTFGAFSPDANRMVVVFGDGPVVSLDPASDIERLARAGVTLSAVAGYDHAAKAASDPYWNDLTRALGGTVYDIDTRKDGYLGLMETVARDQSFASNKSFTKMDRSMQIVPDVRQQLNAVFNVILREINYAHMSGLDLNDPPLAGQPFFLPIYPDRPLEMGNVRINPIFSSLNGLNYIVTSADGTQGNNEVALRIADIRDSKVIGAFEGTLTIDEYYLSFMANLSNGGAEAQRIYTSQNMLVNLSDSNRISIMGVNMEEELTYMLKFKHAYDANARSINVIDGMFDMIINRMGVAGLR